MKFIPVTTIEQARRLSDEMPQLIAVDTEYETGDPRSTKLLKVIVADFSRAWSVDAALLPEITNALETRAGIFLQDYNHCDTIILLKHGCDLRRTPCYNLIDMHHLIDENADHDLGSRILETYGDNYKAEFWKKYKNYSDAPFEDALEYECKDGIYTFRLGVADLETLRANNCEELYVHVRELSKALLETELSGLPVDRALIEETKKKMEPVLLEYPKQLREHFADYCQQWELDAWVKDMMKLKTDKGRAKRPKPVFNFASDDQISKLLYVYMGLPVLALTPKKKSPKTGKIGGGNPKVDYDTIEKLGRDYPEVLPLLKYMEIKTIYGTFVEGLLSRVEAGRIYPHFNVSGTKTGRISHSDPNMGNMPKEGPYRNFFLPSPGCKIIGADYAQLEVVVELNLTEDPGLKQIVCEGASKHDLFMDELHKAGFPLPRGQVKNVNFALQYGAQAKKISKMVGCSIQDAERIIEVFYNKFSGVKALKDATCKQLRDQWKITNLAGRTRHFIPTNNGFQLAKYERQAYNFLIQGVAGEACNRAFYRFQQWASNQIDAVPTALFPVHDEIVAECLSDSSTYTMENLVRIMEQSTKDFNFKYPLTAKAYGPLDRWEKA